VKPPPADGALRPELREAFAVAVRAAIGLVFPPSRAAALDQGVGRAAAVLGEPDPEGLLARLVAGDPAAREALAVELTVGETYLFRDDDHFTFVRDVALPEAARRGGGVRLWSAGCATGEEAWSLAVVAHEALGAAARDVTVIGTDLNPRSLERAAAGWYGPWSFRGVDPGRRERWFVPERNGWRVAPELRATVRFAPLNLLDDPAAWPAAVDVIFCRNVAIYFDLETVARVASGFARSLRPGGWLVPGPSDPLLPGDLGLAATLRGPLVYRRAEPAAPPRPPTRRPSLPRLRPRAAPPGVGAPPRASRPSPAPTPTPAVERARALADRGDVAGAALLLDAALGADGLDPALYLLRSTVRQAAGDDRGAAADAERAIVLDRTLAFAHVLSASARARLGEVAAARRALRNARALLLPADDAPVPLASGQGRASLLAFCERLNRTLGPAAPPPTGAPRG
jgi:chemotaxis protein methyltransferase CheR